MRVMSANRTGRRGGEVRRRGQVDATNAHETDGEQPDLIIVIDGDEDALRSQDYRSTHGADFLKCKKGSRSRTAAMLECFAQS